MGVPKRAPEETLSMLECTPLVLSCRLCLLTISDIGTLTCVGDSVVLHDPSKDDFFPLGPSDKYSETSFTNPLECQQRLLVQEYKVLGTNIYQVLRP